MLDSCEPEYQWAPRTLKQGMLVQFRDPHAEPPEPFGIQRGMVLSCNTFNASGSGAVIVCPLVTADSNPYRNLFNENYGIRLPTGIVQTQDTQFFRPDFAKAVAPAFSSLKPLGVTLDPAADPNDIVVFSKDIVTEASKKLISIVAPGYDGTKLQETHKWGYGYYGWFNKFPHVQDKIVADTPAIILTPQSLWKRTGAALALRAYTNVTKFNHRTCVYLAPQGFKQSFISVSSLMLINPESRQSTGSGQQYVQFGRECMEEIALKMRGVFSSEAYGLVEHKVPGTNGQLPRTGYTGAPRYH